MTETLEKAQQERTERAREALRTQAFQILAHGGDEWSVKNGDKQPYLVRREADHWNCTCPDFAKRGTEVRCKHIEAVRLSTEEAIATPTTHIIHEEMNMNETPQVDLNQILWNLRQPLDMTRVKRRQAPGMGTVPYLEGYDVIERANEIFNFRWSFDLLSQPTVTRWQKVQMAYNQQQRRKLPVLDDQGHPITEEVGIVWITGQVVIELGNQSFRHADVGRCIFAGDTPEALDMAVAGASTDCLKRCFRHLGEQFGLSLYDKEVAQTAGLEGNGDSRGQGNGSSNGNGSHSTSHTAPSRASAPVTRPTPAAGLSATEAARVVFTLKPKTRPELTGKTLGELSTLAPDILTWLANEFTASPETQSIKDAARVLIDPKGRENKILSELGFGN